MYPSGIPGITARPVFIGGGLSLRAVESGPADGPPVLLVHGFGANVYSFAEMLPALAAAGHRAIAVELPGHGLSDKPDDESLYTRAALGDAVLAAAGALGVRRCAIVGHSMGGGLALDLAMRRSDVVEAAVLINSIGLGTPRAMSLLRLASPSAVNAVTPVLLRRWLIAGILRVAFATSARPVERDVDEYWAPTQFREFAWACRACVHRYAWGRVSPAELQALRVPVLVIAGGRDAVVRGGAEHARHIPRARVVRVPEGGHLVQQECAARVNEEVLRFLHDARPRRA